MNLSGNIGEWSEVYALFKLLSDGVLYQGDKDLNKIKNLIYPIISIIRDNVRYNLDNDDRKVIIKSSNDDIFSEIPIKEFTENAEVLLDKIKSIQASKAKKNKTEKVGRAFEVPEIQEFRKSTKVESIKASSQKKADIVIVVHDEVTGFDPTLGFSIKSQLGGASTLLNAENPTNFIYVITPSIPNEEVAKINALSMQAKRLEAIADQGSRLSFVALEPTDGEDSIFECNLVNIDSSMPKLVACMLRYYYSGKASSIQKIAELMSYDNPLHFNMKYHHSYYEVKIKRLLTDVALGMTPQKLWNEIYEANGGYIVVKKDGDIVCYHLYNRNDFEDYLFCNTKLDTPSRSRYNFGRIYKDNGNQYIKLNLQIRFIR